MRLNGQDIFYEGERCAQTVESLLEGGMASLYQHLVEGNNNKRARQPGLLIAGSLIARQREFGFAIIEYGYMDMILTET